MTKTSRENPEYFLKLPIFPDHELAPAIRDQTAENYMTFLGSARLSQDPEALRFGLFKKMLRGLRIPNPAVQQDYRIWLGHSTAELIEQGNAFNTLDDNQINALIVINDPAIFVINSLERLRANHYPEFKREESKMRELNDTYDLILSSIHGPALSRLGLLTATGGD